MNGLLNYVINSFTDFDEIQYEKLPANVVEHFRLSVILIRMTYDFGRPEVFFSVRPTHSSKGLVEMRLSLKSCLTA